MKILNLTQHQATRDQIDQGVVDLTEDRRTILAGLLTFDDLPTPYEIESRAHDIAEIACADGVNEFDAVMLGGAPFFLSTLERVLREEYNVQSVYAFTRRESVDEHMSDGTVRKVSVFRHLGFVRPI